MNELERIVADQTGVNRDKDQSECTIKSKHFTSENDGPGEKDSKTHLQAIVNEEANPQFNFTETSANTLLFNVNRSDRLGGIHCGTKLQALINENKYLNHRTVDIVSNIQENYQANDNRMKENKDQHRPNNEDQHEQVDKHQEIGNAEFKGTGSLQITHPKQKLRNANTSQSRSQPSLITTPPKLGQIKGQIVAHKQKIQPANHHYI
ncbi:MAG: hypothetical protein EZS28_020920 [Streblomastix strix]|uniref:Uncharacterized protein n=1 Tax=Streblomastix strix TaxID=222440 RepID=A0A5J4VLT3_9EUKA|nr:MAG: hypothetical protein EZS28_020920 [Streblomastix strix]